MEELKKNKSAKPFTEAEIAEIIKQILSAINYLNNKKILHRDIKPENIMFVNNDKKLIKLIDFGLAVHKD